MILSVILITISCKHTPPARPSVPSQYVHLEPKYGAIRLVSQKDTLSFPLGEHTYNAVKSFNFFQHDGTTFISFYDKGSKSLNIYHFGTQRLVKSVPLSDWVNSGKLDKASVFVENLDSIFIATQSRLFLLDSAGTVKKEIEFIEEIDKQGFISNTAPAIFRDSTLFIGIKPFVEENSLQMHQKWRVLYGFNLQNGTKTLYYQLPEIYQKDLYGYSFLDYSYCLNAAGNFVFSFPADPNIYESDLANYHKAYLGKSKFQTTPISPPLPRAMHQSDSSFKYYSLSDSYGPIYYDPYKKRYLRLAKQKISERSFQEKKFRKNRSIIIFNDQFNIIGEFEFNDEFSFSSIFFADGDTYARVNSKDEHALHYVRLVYQENEPGNIQLTQHKVSAE